MSKTLRYSWLVNSAIGKRLFTNMPVIVTLRHARKGIRYRPFEFRLFQPSFESLPPVVVENKRNRTWENAAMKY